MGCWALRPRKIGLRFIVLDDNSTDDTPTILSGLAEELPVTVIRHDCSLGFGGSLRDGIARAETPWLLFVDADAQYSPEDIRDFLAYPRDSLTLLSGWRRHRADPLIRIFISLVFRIMNRVAFGVRMKDITSSLKLVPTAQAKEVAAQIRYMNGSFWSEFMVRWAGSGYTWKEVQIEHLPRKGSRSKVFEPGQIGRLIVHQFVGFLKLLRELSTVKRQAGLPSARQQEATH